jgi:hypothetical protein
VSEHSWRPQNLIEIAANPPEPPLIGKLLYRAKRVVLSGETESLKTWLALILSKADMDIGLCVCWADLDAMGAGELLDRLRALGVADEVIAERFLYYEPTEALKAGRLDDVCALLRDRGVRLFVVDAFNSMLQLHGLDPTKTPDVEAFWREVADPLTKEGAAPTLLDHVVKNAKSGDKYAYGSERKASGAIVHIGFKIVHPLTRGGTGSTKLSTHKDRPGHLPRPTIGRLVLTSDGDWIDYALEADQSRAGTTWRPTGLMEKVSSFLASHDGPASRSTIVEKVKGSKAEYKRAAIDALVEGGYAIQTDGPRGAKLVEFDHAYHESDDEDEVLDPDETTPSPPRPDPVPDLRSILSSTPSPESPYGDEGRGRVDIVPSVVPTPSQACVDGHAGSDGLALFGDEQKARRHERGEA